VILQNEANLEASQLWSAFCGCSRIASDALLLDAVRRDVSANLSRNRDLPRGKLVMTLTEVLLDLEQIAKVNDRPR
jgi:hypothetical protein